MSKVINFYDPKDPYYEFSNFYGLPKDKKFKLYIDGQDWDTTEHYYQANKFLGPDKTPESEEYARLVGTASTPNKAFVLARQVPKGGYASKWKHSASNSNTLNDLIKTYKGKGVTMRSDWDTAKEVVMIKAVREKFKQNPHLAKILTNTGDAVLHEHTSRDKYWGDGGDGSGKDRLGQILMQIRDELTQSGSVGISKKIPIKSKKIPIKSKKVPIGFKPCPCTLTAPAAPAAQTLKSRTYDLSVCTDIPTDYSELREVSKYLTLPANVKKVQMTKNIMDLCKLLKNQGVTNLNNMSGPIYNSNWVLPDKLLVGAYPGDTDPDQHLSKIQSLINIGVTDFISLQPQSELDKLSPYQEIAQTLTDKQLRFHNFPIVDMNVVDDKTMIEYIDQILTIVSEESLIYLHCLGGHGRTGTIIAILLGKMYDLSADQALRLTSVYHITRWIKNKPHKTSKYLKRSPQRKCQVDQVKRLLK